MRWTSFLGVMIWTTIFSLPHSAHAIDYLKVRKPLKVYETTNSRTKPIRELERGDTVPISKRVYGEFRKILFTHQGEKKPGYVRADQINADDISDRENIEKSGEKGVVYHTGKAVGVWLSGSFSSQAARRISDGEGPSIQVGDMQGFSAFYGFFADFPLTQRFVLRPFASFRRSTMAGTARISSSESKPILLVQTFMGGGALLKYYLGVAGDIWIGPSFEVARANSVSLSYADSTSVPVDPAAFPTFFIVQGALGGDFHIAKKFYLLPELRVGSVVNSTPSITIGELNLAVAYRF